MSSFDVPLFIRGELIAENWREFGLRGDGGDGFRAPDPRQYLQQLPLSSPMALRDLHEIPFDEILDLLEALGQALEFEHSPHIQQAFDAAMVAANYPASMLQR